MKQTIIFLLAIVVVFASCKTEVDLNAPYKNTTIVFGLLDVDINGDGLRNQLDTQWIKINRTFLGEGDNTVYAGIRDSSEYSEGDFVKKMVQQIDPNGNIIEYDLIAKTDSNRNVNGVFYGPEQTVYYFTPVPSGLNPNSEYRLLLEFTDGRVVTSSTNLINSGGASNWISPQNGITLQLANVAACPNVLYTPQVTLQWYSMGNASIYEATLRFYYTEERLVGGVWTGDGVERHVDYYLGSAKQEDAVNGRLKITFDGRGFFAMLANKLEADPNTRRQIGRYNGEFTECFDVMLTIGNEDLNAYIDVNTPSTGLVQERPIYSNISNGIGLFASRGTSYLINIPLVSQQGQSNPGNRWALKCSEYTSALNFCDPEPGVIAPYGCE